MSKQTNYNEVTKIYEIIIKKLNFNISIYDLVKKYIKSNNDEVFVINELIKKLNDNGYTIENVDPLKVKEI